MKQRACTKCGAVDDENQQSVCEKISGQQSGGTIAMQVGPSNNLQELALAIGGPSYFGMRATPPRKDQRSCF